MTISSRVRSVRKWANRPESLTAGIVLFVLVVVEVGVALGYIDTLLLRQPTKIFSELVVQIQSPEMIRDILYSIQRVLITMALSISIGGFLSIIFWRYDLLRRAYIPILGAMFATPLVLLYPIFVVIFGRGTAAIVAISFAVGAIPIIINATGALATVNETFVEVGRTFNASRHQLMTKVILPDAAPEIFAGIRISFAYVVTSVIAVEFLMIVRPGLGGAISNAYLRFQTTEMFVSVTFVIIFVVLSVAILRQLEGVVRR